MIRENQNADIPVINSCEKMSKSSIHWRLNVAEFLHIEKPKKAMPSISEKCYLQLKSFLVRSQNEDVYMNAEKTKHGRFSSTSPILNKTCHHYQKCCGSS